MTGNLALGCRWTCALFIPSGWSARPILSRPHTLGFCSGLVLPSTEATMAVLRCRSSRASLGGFIRPSYPEGLSVSRRIAWVGDGYICLVVHRPLHLLFPSSLSFTTPSQRKWHA